MAPEDDPLEFVNIAVTGDGLYGMTGQGGVWKYDASSRLWKPLPMISEPALQGAGAGR